MAFYEAIAYTWGNPDRTEEIMVSGCRMKVTKSVYEVLATLSSQFLPQLLWIDAICIDQENSEEKEQQVPIMDKIYSNALITTVFLGQVPLPQTKPSEKGNTIPFKFDGICPPNEQTRKHFETARLTIDTFKEFNILREHLRSSGKLMYELYDVFLSDATKSLQWQALVTFLQHPWFARVWVVQEVALSPHVQVRYGDETIDWRIMASAMEMIHDLRHFRLWLEWSHQPSEKYSFTDEITITQVLAESSYFKATDPRDQVYGLMSLCREKNTFKVDYQAVFGANFGLAGIGNRPSGHELGTEALKLPSWVPDWTSAPKYEKIHHPDEQNVHYRWNLRIGKIKEPKPAVTLVKENALTMTGVFVDTIAEIGPSLFNTDITASEGIVEEMHRLWKNCNECREFLTNSIHTSDPYPHAENQSLLEAFYHSLVTGFKVDLVTWMRELEHFRNMPATDSSDERDRIYNVLQSMDTTTQKIESCCGGRRVFVGAGGWIGLCPPEARSGDKIFSVKGVKVPIMVRGLGEDIEGQFGLVGECCCHRLVPGRMKLLEMEIDVV
ncbi:hypothetical protein IFR05_003227 [Cadophora sp. M221]|nr:hypothetical protein IFR05_003227 [Cadophora sp. M221]